ncbi:BTB/POZ domain-containing protein 6-B [Culicoides brevitarsis]|uniref:BTB/POZ domain-containing protein 6-B n=1 Tax=Culicoides brevitarsis TaxID=469753 RepID=UPI00307CB6BA
MGKMVQPFGSTYDDNATNNTATTATAPPMEAVDLQTSYVEFILLGDRENYVVRAERRAIVESQCELSRIFQSGGTTAVRRVDENRFSVSESNKENFELFIRFLETKFIKFQDAQHTLEMLEIASRYRCPELEVKCVKELDMFLSDKSVLKVFRALWLYNSIIPPVKAKDLRGKSRQKAKELPTFTPEEYFAALLNNCLQLIEMHAAEIFQQPEMTKLSFKELEMIVKRDALQMPYETVLYDLLSSWSKEECLRKNIDLTSENRRRVLGALCYTPRYLTMSSSEFQSLKDRVELLDTSEVALVTEAFKNKKQSNLTPEQTELLNSFKKQRPPFPLLPIQLSERSNAKNYPKKMRRYVADLEKENDPQRSCCHRSILNCVGVFAFIFD